MSDDLNSLLTLAGLGFSQNLKTSVSQQKRFQLMPGVVVREDESFENALRRFKKQLQKSGVLGEAKRRRAYDKPSIKKKKKSLLARKRLLRKLRKMQRTRQR
jgi:small subunit ribosomal protein S21